MTEMERVRGETEKRGERRKKREVRMGGVTWQLSGLSDGRDYGAKPCRNVSQVC